MSEYTQPTTILFGGNDWADQTGAKYLEENHNKFKVQILESGDHMLPLSK